MTTLQVVIGVLCGLTTISLVVDVVRDRTVSNVTFAGLALVQAGLLVQLVWGLVRLAGPHPGVQVGAYLGYLVGALVILPAGFLWSVSEKSRSGTAVLLVAVLVVPVLLLRLEHLWAGHA